MFHIAAYFTASLSTVANLDVPALSDQVLSISNNHFRLVDGMQLLGAAGMSATLQRIRLDSPTLRIQGNPYILPPNVGATPIAEGRFMDLSKYPLQLPVREEVAMQATSGIAMGNENFTGLIVLTPNITPAPPGRIFWVRATSTTTAVVNSWTTLTLTLESALPSGYFSVVGSRVQSTTGQAHRFIFPGQVWRPGNLSVVGLGNRAPDSSWNGAFGEYGRFVNDNPFQMQVLCNAADTAHEIYIGLVQVGSL